MACLDTTVPIDLIGRPGARREQAIGKIKELVERGEELATTRFNLAELYVGIARSGHPEKEEKAIRAFGGDLTILDFNDAAARLFGSITGRLQEIGRPAGDMDVLIAATAIIHGHIVITRNVRRFKDIPHLTVESY
jgi:tRNA(fMet)-specific endonuclease VapC